MKILLQYILKFGIRVLLVLTVGVMCVCSGCVTLYVSFILWDKFSDDDKYKGDYPELFSVAINSILGTIGFESGERPFQADVRFIEKDSLDRAMFIYYEGRAISTTALLYVREKMGTTHTIILIITLYLFQRNHNTSIVPLTSIRH